MPKQIFQRPAPINHQKISKQKGSPFGQPDFGRKKNAGKKPVLKTDRHSQNTKPIQS